MVSGFGLIIHPRRIFGTNLFSTLRKQSNFTSKKAKTRTDQERIGIYVISNMDDLLKRFMAMTRAETFVSDTYTHTHCGHLI